MSAKKVVCDYSIAGEGYKPLCAYFAGILGCTSNDTIKGIIDDLDNYCMNT